MSFFQILAPNGTALEDQRENSDSDSDPIFTKNELKENQFWYLDIVPGSDYGYIGSKKYPGRTNQVFTLGTCFKATVESGIVVPVGIIVLVGIFVKINERTAL